MRRIATALALCSALAGPAFAEESYEQRVALATSYVEATLQDLDMSAMIETMWRPIISDIQSKDIPLSDVQITQIANLYEDEMTEPMYKIMREQALVMAQVFTFDEIKAIRDFYATDLGRAAMTKLPQIAERQTPMVLRMVQEKMPTIIPQIQGILSEGAAAQ